MRIDTKAHRKIDISNPSMLDERPLRQFLGYTMKRAYVHVQEDMLKSLEPLGLRIGTFSALAVVSANPGISQSRVADALNIKRSGVVLLIDELERAKALRRAPVEGDRRAYALRVTPAGERLWSEAERAVRAHEERFFADLSRGERKSLHNLLNRAARFGAIKGGDENRA